MKEILLNDLDDRKKYNAFIKYMLANSDYFSLVYFKHTENEAFTDTVMEIQSLLEQDVICCENVTHWPGTWTLNENNHIYRLVVYRKSKNSYEALTKVSSVYDWDYDARPMDLAFYNDGYAWFQSSSHEKWNALYTENLHVLDHLKALGIAYNVISTLTNEQANMFVYRLEITNK